MPLYLPATAVPEYSRNIAFVIGINNYESGIFPLQNAVNDTKKLVKTLREQYGFQVWEYWNEMATLSTLKKLLTEILPKQVDSADRLLFYFAGYGIELDSKEDCPQGYLIPQDAVLGDTNTYLSLSYIHQSLSQLPFCHFLTILDCCFSETLCGCPAKNSSSVSNIYREDDEQSISKSLQVITSKAASNDHTHRHQINKHSSFATALSESLKDNTNVSLPTANVQSVEDKLDIATERYLYLCECIEAIASRNCSKQSSRIWTLKTYDKGEYIFPAFNPQHKSRFALKSNESENAKNKVQSSHRHFNQEQFSLISSLKFNQVAVSSKLQNFQKKHRKIIFLGSLMIAVFSGFSIMAIFAVVQTQYLIVDEILTSKKSLTASSDLNQDIQEKTPSPPKPSFSPKPLPIIAEDFYTRGISEIERFNQGKFIKYYNKILHKNPDKVDAYINRGVAYYRKGKYEQAIFNFHQALKRDSENVHAHVNRAIAYHRLGKYELTLASCNLAISINPKFIDAYITRGIAYRWLGKYEEAMTDFNKAISINPQNSDSYYALGLINTQLHNKQAAIKNYRQAANLYQQQGKSAYSQSALKRIKELQ